MSVVYKSRAELRVEGATALEVFLRSGGSVEVVKARRAPKMVMRGKSSRTSSLGTSGFAVGFPSKSFV